MKASLDIVAAFQEVASRPGKPIPKIGVGCGNHRCCFAAGVYAEWADCPYHDVPLNEIGH